MNIENLQLSLANAIESENFEQAAKIRDQITQAIANAEKPATGADWRERLHEAYGQVQATVPQLLTPACDLELPPTHHKSIFYRQYPSDDWCESSQSCKDYEPHTLADIESTIDAIGNHIDLTGCEFTFGWSGGERIKIKGFEDQIDLGGDDKILPIIDLSAGYDLKCPYRLSFGQDVFKCTNGLTIIRGKLAAGSSKKHSKNTQANIVDLVSDFAVDFKQYTESVDVFKRMSGTVCTDWRKTIGIIVGGNNKDDSKQKQDRYNAIVQRVERESVGIDVTNWRVSQAVHGYFQHEHSTTKKMSLATDKADWANNRSEVSKAFELLAV